MTGRAVFVAALAAVGAVDLVLFAVVALPLLATLITHTALSGSTA